MSLLVVTPELLTSAAADLESIGSRLNAAHLAAAVPTTGLAAAAADEVSAAVSALFAGYGQHGFFGALDHGWQALLSAVHSVVVAAGFLIPWISVLAVGVVIGLVVRRRRKARKP